MATYSPVKSTHQTLVGSTADTVNLLQRWDGIEVSNRGSVPIYLTWNGTTATVAGDNTDIIEAGVTKEFVPPFLTANNMPFTSGNPAHTLSLISSGTPAYSVIGMTVSP